MQYTNREIFVPQLEQKILKISFIINGKYEQKLADKFLKTIYDRTELQKKQQQSDFSILKSIQRSREQEE